MEPLNLKLLAAESELASFLFHEDARRLVREAELERRREISEQEHADYLSDVRHGRLE